jgi:hypothetical protein
VGPGFKKTHVRKRIGEPLQGANVTLHALESAVRPEKKYGGLGYLQTRGTIPGGFAWRLGEGVVLWGVAEPNGHVTCLCLSGHPAAQDLPALSAALAAVGEKHGVDLVDWCRAAAIKPEARAMAEQKGDGGEKLIASNPNRGSYVIDQVVEAGVVLTGTEVKSLRASSPNLRDAFVEVNAKKGSPSLEACLAHNEADKVRAAYNRAQFNDERRALLKAWSEFLMRPSAANVVPLKAA